MVRSRAQTEGAANPYRKKTRGRPLGTRSPTFCDVTVAIWLSGICAVPVVREELETGVDTHSYLQLALDTLDDESPVTTVSVSLRASAEMIYR